MNFLKPFLFVLITSTFCTNLTAVPVYASQWKRGDQTVTLYGDLHAPDNQTEFVDAFMANLTLTTQNTLVLIECPASFNLLTAVPQFSTFISPTGDEYEFLYMLAQALFCHNDQQLPRNVIAKNTDHRKEVLFCRLFTEACYKKADTNLLKETAAYVDLDSLSDVLEYPIDAIDELIETSCNYEAKRIFGDLIQTMRSRQQLFLRYVNYRDGSDLLETSTAKTKIVYAQL